MALITKIHAGRFELRDADGTLKGQVVRQEAGWYFRNGKGYGPRQPRSTVGSALELATILSFLPKCAGGWAKLVAEAEQGFEHNARIAGL